MKVSIVIPARYASTRFPGKLLAPLGDRPVLWHTWQAAKNMKLADELIVAVDDERLHQAVESWGGTARMTGSEHSSGLERIASLVHELKGDIILNVQGDEPFIDPSLLDAIIERAKVSPAPILTAVCPIHREEDIFNPNVVKVILSQESKALYFSRSPIPYVRDVPASEWLQQASFYGHIGVYCYKRAVLENYAKLPQSRLEEAEKLEQLKFLDYGYTLEAIKTNSRPQGVDTPEDLQKLQAQLSCRDAA
jgi:3-deoxy-manno-octulosonate cytidylyltransferase (CMP-KDO synthetase)